MPQIPETPEPPSQILAGLGISGLPPGAGKSEGWGAQRAILKEDAEARPGDILALRMGMRAEDLLPPKP